MFPLGLDYKLLITTEFQCYEWKSVWVIFSFELFQWNELNKVCKKIFFYFSCDQIPAFIMRRFDKLQSNQQKIKNEINISFYEFN